MDARVQSEMGLLAVNLRRVMAREGLTVEGVVERTGLDERTVKGMLAGRGKPQARSLGRLAEGLGVSVDEFFQDPSLLAYRLFDRATNPVVDEVLSAQPELVRGWSQADFDELYSRFGDGGALTFAGAVVAIEQMNRKHELLRKVSLLLETQDAELLASLVETLYRRVTPVASEVKPSARNEV